MPPISDAATSSSDEEFHPARRRRERVHDAREGGAVILHFGAGDGNDTLEGEGYVGTPPSFGQFNFDWRFGVGKVDAIEAAYP